MIARYMAVGALACMMALSAQAQRSLTSLVSDAEAEWMFGKWQAQSENGDSITLNVTWDLDKHVVVLHLKTGEMEAKGYTVMEPNAELPKYYAFDNQGFVGKGSWNMENNELVLRLEGESPSASAWKGAFVFTGSATEGLQVRQHSIDSSGDLATPAKSTYKFKKAK